MLVEISEDEAYLILSLLDDVPDIEADALRQKLKGIRPERRMKKTVCVSLYADQVEHYAPGELSGRIRDLIDYVNRKEDVRIAD